MSLEDVFFCFTHYANPLGRLLARAHPRQFSTLTLPSHLHPRCAPQPRRIAPSGAQAPRCFLLEALAAVIGRRSAISKRLFGGADA